MNKKLRLDQAMVQRGLVRTRSQAESYVKLGQVKVGNVVVTKPGFSVTENAQIRMTTKEQYVSRAGLKLESVAKALRLNFNGKNVLDVGSSTGGFTDFALRHGAKKVVAVDVGTGQLHPSLHGNPQIEVHEQTDIRDFTPLVTPDIVLMDVSFISLRELLPHIAAISDKHTEVAAMVKPQFEAGDNAKHKGVIKNDRLRRDILKDFEIWARERFAVIEKADSDIEGAKGNRERFYLLIKL